MAESLCCSPETITTLLISCVHACVRAKSLHSCPSLCDPVECSLPGSSVQGIHQARKLEWVAMPSSRGSSLPRDGTHISYISCIGRWVLYHWCHLGSPKHTFYSQAVLSDSQCLLQKCKKLFTSLSSY